MRKREKEAARQLRKEGKSIKEIERLIGVGRSSISVWVRDIQLSEKQKERLASRNLSIDVLERRRQTRFANGYKERYPFLLQGIADIDALNEIDVLMLGLGLYWGEGSKTNRGIIELSNSDPRIIQMFVLFLTKVCKFERGQLRAHVSVHSHISFNTAEEYWSKISGISTTQFYRTSVQKSRAGKGERDALPYGTFSVSVNNTKMRIRLEGWIQGVYKRLFPHHTDLHTMTKLRI